LLPPTLGSNARAQEKSGKNDAKPDETAISLSDSDFSDNYPSPLAGGIRKNGMVENPIDKRKDARRALRRAENGTFFTDVKMREKIAPAGRMTGF
jgi:hypothetical protein